MKGFSTPHTRYPANPQTYFGHWKVAMGGALNLFRYSISSVIHAFFPEIKFFQFHASSGIISMYRSLEESGRHDGEIEKIFGRKRREHIKVNRGG
jgi:hypothetical protein